MDSGEPRLGGDARFDGVPRSDGLLPDGVRAALLYGADLIFLEFAHDAVTDPVALAGRRLGMYFQGFHGGQYTTAELANQLDEMRDWLTIDLILSKLRSSNAETSLADFAADLVDTSFLAASVCFAQAILYLAAGADERVPATAQPYRAHLQPMVERLVEKRTNGDVSMQEAHLIFPWLADP